MVSLGSGWLRDDGDVAGSWAPQVSELSHLRNGSRGALCISKCLRATWKRTRLSALDWINHRHYEVCGVSECNNSNPSPYKISRTCKANIDYICSIKYTANPRKAELES